MYVCILPSSSSKVTEFPLVTDIRWLGITNLTSNGPDGTIGATRAFSGPTSVGTLTFTEKVRSSSTLLRIYASFRPDRHNS